MDRRLTWIGGLLALQVALLWATLQVPRFGEAMWHHGASLGVALFVSAAFWRPLARSRRFLAFGVFTFTILATASGFWLLYWKEGLRVDGLQDWGRWWHVLWSWFAMVFFFQHTWINWATYLRFARRTLATMSGRLLHGGAYVIVLVALAVTWSALGRDWFTGTNYIPLTLYTWLVFAVPPYLLWMYVRTGLSFPLSRPRVARLFTRRRVQIWFSVALVPIAALAIVSGVPLTFFDGFMDAWGLKYASKYWHVWPSVAFAVLVFGHALHSWSAVTAHWRSYAAPRRQRERAPRDATPGATAPLATAPKSRGSTHGRRPVRRNQ